jgi:negative regulator of replication initiation
VADDNLRIRVTADISNLQSQMAAGAATVRDGADDMAAGARAAGEAFEEMGERATRSMRAMRQQLIENLEGDWKAAQTRIKGQEAVIEGQGARGEISKPDELERLRVLHQQELAEEAQFVQRMIDVASVYYPRDAKEMTELANRLKTIHAQMEEQWTKDTQNLLTAEQQKYQQFFTTVSHGFTTALNGWLQGTQTFSKACQKLWQSLAMSAIQEIEKLGERWILTHILMAAANALFHTQAAAQDTAATAEKVAQTSATNYMEAVGYANVAAAQTLADVPFPANIPASASTLALGMSYAGMSAFALGGVVPRTQVALVHGGERVLTPSQNMAFERLARGGFASNITQHIHGVSNPVRAAHLASTMAVGRVRRLASDWGYR